LEDIDYREEMSVFDLDDVTDTSYNVQKHSNTTKYATEKKLENERYLKELKSQREEYIQNKAIELKKYQDELSKLTPESENYNKALTDVENAQELYNNALKGNTAFLQDNQKATRQVEVNIKGLEKVINENKDKFQELRQAGIDMFTDWAVNGNSWKNIMKKLMQDFASDAIRRLFQVKNAASQTSIFGQLIGRLFGHSGGSSSSSGSSSGYSGNVTTAVTGGITSLFHATGGIFDQEHLAVLNERNKKEAVIPLEDNQDRGRAIWLQSGEALGMLGKSNGVVPTLRNPNLQQQISVEMQQSKEHIQELQKSNQLMSQQLQVLTFIANKESNNGTTVAQPIVLSNAMSMNDFVGMLGQAQSRRYIK